ncbi:DUF7373 family lipoprotein [Gordonia paraffinivorans]|uniref:DUF7373 family lipoprotein n=1 Tax=Gordonia paraffinivorans TaxID=175628 RepID=UPI00144657BC|nr:hypothetical protein [Gordonia paraffinivorans]
MKDWRPIVAVATAALVVAGTAACTTDGQPVPSAKDAEAATSSVDLAALDTGDYPTEPRPPFDYPADDAEFLRVEGQRMGQFIIPPFELAPDVTQPNALFTAPIASRAALGVLFGEGAATIPANERFLGGFSTSARTPASGPREQRNLQIVVLRYLTPGDARAAVDQLARITSRGWNNAPITPLQGVPGGVFLNAVSPGDGGHHAAGYTQRDVYAVYAWTRVSTAEAAAQSESLIRTALTRQADLISKFPRTPSAQDNRNMGRAPVAGRPRMDENKILVYALPYSDQEIAEKKTGLNPLAVRAVYGPRGLAHFAADPPMTLNAAERAGSLATAVDRSIVFRAETPEKAEEYLMPKADDSDSTTAIAPPPGLPAARCEATPTGGDRTAYQCAVQVGRYVAILGSSSKRDVYQQTSAQYLILTKADQNAN